MRINVEKRLFWFLKDRTELDLSNKSYMDMYVQQALSKGSTSDVRKLLRTVNPSDFAESFCRIKSLLPAEVRSFWEDWVGDINRAAEKDTPPV